MVPLATVFDSGELQWEIMEALNRYVSYLVYENRQTALVLRGNALDIQSQSYN
jgi:hypothetical protein